MNQVEIFNETSEPLDEVCRNIEKLLMYTLEQEQVANAYCNVIFVGKKYIQKLNKTYRNIDRVTDVISFALEDNLDIKMEQRLLGDIYICLDKALEQALEYNHSNNREISFLAVHGLLHLLGYDHIEKADEEKMFKRQEEVLTNYGIVR